MTNRAMGFGRVTVANQCFAFLLTFLFSFSPLAQAEELLPRDSAISKDPMLLDGLEVGGWSRLFRYDDSGRPTAVFAWGDPQTLHTPDGQIQAHALLFVVIGDDVQVYLPRTQDVQLALGDLQLRWGFGSTEKARHVLGVRDPKDWIAASMLEWADISDSWDGNGDGNLDTRDLQEGVPSQRGAMSAQASLPRRILCGPCGDPTGGPDSCYIDATEVMTFSLLGYSLPQPQIQSHIRRTISGISIPTPGFVPANPEGAEFDNLPASCRFTGFDICAGMGHLDCNHNGVLDQCDVTFGLSGDCNHDSVPDECQQDCNSNGIADECEFRSDCNANCVADVNDILSGTSFDCNQNGRPDECEGDCNGNGVPDDCDVDPADPDGDGIVHPDCDQDGRPDLTDVTQGGQCAVDCNDNSVPDDCDVDPSDPDGDGMVWPDCNRNGRPDVSSCEWTDCNGNGIPDDCDVDPTDPDGDGAVFPDCDGDLIPDIISATCETDCNGTGLPDPCDVLQGASLDCNGNMMPDECEVSAGADCNGNGVPDDCDIAATTSEDCYAHGVGNGIPDECEPDCDGNGFADSCDVQVEGRDCNSDGILDVCQPDCDGSGVPDVCERDCNGNGYHDQCDVLNGVSADLDENGVPDECEDCDTNAIPDSMQGCKVDIMFIADTSGSMCDELVALTQAAETISETLDACLTVDLKYHLYEIAEHDIECQEEDFELNGRVCPDVSCDVPMQVDGSEPACASHLGGGDLDHESWGPAVSIVANDVGNPETTIWRNDSIKIIVPLADEGPCGGNPCDVTGADGESIWQAIAHAQMHNIVVSPIIGSFNPDLPNDIPCLESLSNLVAEQTGGTAFYLGDTEMGPELQNAIGYSIARIIQENCAADRDLNCVLDHCQ